MSTLYKKSRLKSNPKCDKLLPPQFWFQSVSVVSNRTSFEGHPTPQQADRCPSFGNGSSVLNRTIISLWGQYYTLTNEREMAMRLIFWGFCKNRFLMSPLHYLLRRSEFGFKFAGIFVTEKHLSV
jgi:hypothetical protein